MKMEDKTAADERMREEKNAPGWLIIHLVGEKRSEQMLLVMRVHKLCK